jgi:hypothetical protein
MALIRHQTFFEENLPAEFGSEQDRFAKKRDGSYFGDVDLAWKIFGLGYAAEARDHAELEQKVKRAGEVIARLVKRTPFTPADDGITVTLPMDQLKELQELYRLLNGIPPQD